MVDCTELNDKISDSQSDTWMGRKIENTIDLPLPVYEEPLYNHHNVIIMNDIFHHSSQ